MDLLDLRDHAVDAGAGALYRRCPADVDARVAYSLADRAFAALLAYGFVRQVRPGSARAQQHFGSSIEDVPQDFTSAYGLAVDLVGVAMDTQASMPDFAARSLRRDVITGMSQALVCAVVHADLFVRPYALEV